MVDAAKPIVTITGVSGFIGSQVCLDFLKSGEYRVRGTVRDKDNEAKIAPLRKAFGEYFDQLELANADLLNAESLTAAVAGSTYVVHTASPFFFPKDDQDVIKPAVDGTLAVMNACLAAGVKRCVVTSSFAAIACPAKEHQPDPETGFWDETIWTDPDRPEGCIGYVKSKLLAEKAAWDFQKSLPEDKKFEIVCINPCYVEGPSLIPGGFTSADIIAKYFNGTVTEVSTYRMGFVDVRDVSKMHFEGLRRPEAANKRFLAFSEWLYPKEVADALHAHFAPQGYTVVTKEAGSERNKTARANTQQARDILGIDFIPARDSCIAMAQSMIDCGVITKL